MKRNVIGILLFVVLGGGYTAFDYFTGSEFGGPCQWNNDCKGSFYGKYGAQCLDMGNGSGFCTVTCSDHAECAANPGWTCQTFDYYEGDVASGTNQVCAPPTGAQPGLPSPYQQMPVPGQVPQAMPGQVPQPMPGQPVAPQPVAPQPVAPVQR